MARISREKQLQLYIKETTRAQAWRRQQGFDALWRRLIDLYRGKFLPEGLSHEDRIAINVAFSTLNVIFPSVSVNHPKISVLGSNPDTEPSAVFSEQVINYQWRHFNFHDPFRLAVKDMLMLGHGWVKVGWRYEERERELSDDEREAEIDRAIAEATSFEPADGAQPPSYDDIVQSVSSSTAVEVTDDRPFVERVSPFDVFVNPEATSMHDLRWIAQRLIVPLVEVRENEAYNRAARMRIKAGLKNAFEDARFSENDRYDTSAYAELWEFYDLLEGTVAVFAESTGEFLVNPTETPFAFGHPFERAENYTVPEQFYPIGDLEMIEPLAQEISKTRSEMMNHRAKYARKYLVRKKAFSRSDIEALQSKRDGLVIPIDDDTPFSELIAPVPAQGADPQLYAWSDQIKADIDEVSGVSEYARGAGPSIRRTATEAAMIQDATNARSADKLASVERFITRIARKLLQVNQQFVTGVQWVRIVGKENKRFYVPYTREDIAGEFDFEVEAGSTQPNNDSFRRQEAIALMQVMAPMIQMGVVDPTEIARHVLRNGFKIRDPEKFLRQQPAPVPADQGGPQALQAGGGPGVDAQQLTPLQRQEAEIQRQMQADSAAIPPEIAAQLANQVGLASASPQ